MRLCHDMSLLMKSLGRWLTPRYSHVRISMRTHRICYIGLGEETAKPIKKTSDPVYVMTVVFGSKYCCWTSYSLSLFLCLMSQLSVVLFTTTIFFWRNIRTASLGLMVLGTASAYGVGTFADCCAPRRAVQSLSAGPYDCELS